VTPPLNVEPLRKSAATAATPPAVQNPTNNTAAPVADQLELNWDQPGLKPAAGSPGEPPNVAATGSADQPVTVGADCGTGTKPDSLPVTHYIPAQKTEVRQIAEALVEELHADHPQPGLPGKAVAEAEPILAAAEDVDATVELIRRNHASWKLHWEILRPGAFIPQLWRWFHDGEWKREVRKPVRQETWYQRQDRLQREFEAGDTLKPLFDAEMEEWRTRAERQECERREEWERQRKLREENKRLQEETLQDTEWLRFDAWEERHARKTA
jgi:hypothetical protein